MPLIEAVGEADPVLALLSMQGAVDAIASDDLDSLAFGARALVRGASFKDGLPSTVVEVLLLVVPVVKLINPLIPASPEFTVRKIIDPLDVSVPSPVVRDIAPPVNGVLPPAIT